MEYLLLAAGLALLVKGADWLVDGAAAVAKRLGISTLVVGLTIVAFGTSMPELVVNVFAAIHGTAAVAFGNVIGSNIANLLLILGIAALITPLKVQHSTVWKEVPFSLLAAVVLLVVSNKLLLDRIDIQALGRIDGLVMLGFLAVFLVYVFELARRRGEQHEEGVEEIEARGKGKSALLIIGGIAALYFGGQWVVDGAVTLARALHLSEFLISATIISIGTSLPELVTSIAAARKRQADLAVGNVVGSNIFNIFFVLAVTALVAPVAIPSYINTDMLVLIGATFALFLFMFIGKRHALERWQGGIFLAGYAAYLAFLIIRG